MKLINLDGRKFSPVKNTENGRVTTSSIFTYSQTEEQFCAVYSGEDFTDGHIIGKFTGADTAELVYHCRGPQSELEVGTANATLHIDDERLINICMDWQWLNLDQSSGQSHYLEKKHDT